jgi:predicted DNA-binding protein (UPF0251 family)
MEILHTELHAFLSASRAKVAKYLLHGQKFRIDFREKNSSSYFIPTEHFILLLRVECT